MSSKEAVRQGSREPFYKTFDDMLAAQDQVTGESWRDFMIRNNYSAEELIRMWDANKRDMEASQTIEHEPTTRPVQARDGADFWRRRPL